MWPQKQSGEELTRERRLSEPHALCLHCDLARSRKRLFFRMLKIGSLIDPTMLSSLPSFSSVMSYFGSCLHSPHPPASSVMLHLLWINHGPLRAREDREGKKFQDPHSTDSFALKLPYPGFLQSFSPPPSLSFSFCLTLTWPPILCVYCKETGT